MSSGDIDSAISTFHKAAKLAARNGDDEAFVEAKYLEGQFVYEDCIDEANDYSLDTGAPNNDPAFDDIFARARAMLSDVVDEPKYENCSYYCECVYLLADILAMTNCSSESEWQPLMDKLIPVTDSIDISDLNDGNSIMGALRKTKFSLVIATYYMNISNGSESEDALIARTNKAREYLTESKNILQSDEYCKVIESDPDLLCSNTKIAMIALENMALLTGNVDYYYEAISLCDTIVTDASEKLISPRYYVELKIEKGSALIDLIDKLSESESDFTDEVISKIFSLSDELYDNSISLIHGRTAYGIDIRLLVTSCVHAIISQQATDEDLAKIFDIFYEYRDSTKKEMDAQELRQKAEYYRKICFSCYTLIYLLDHRDRYIIDFGKDLATELKLTMYDYAEDSFEREQIDILYKFFKNKEWLKEDDESDSAQKNNVS